MGLKLARFRSAKRANLKGLDPVHPSTQIGVLEVLSNRLIPPTSLASLGGLC
jgi:hypothetical protein